MAAAQGDGIFGWQAKGIVTCDPPPDSSPSQQRRRYGIERNPFVLDWKDKDGLSAPPGNSSTVLAAAPSKALAPTDCAEPFRDAEVDHQAQVRWPLMAQLPNFDVTASLQVAIAPDGTLKDAWVWGSSGYSQLDQEAIKAAKLSTYKGARSYCRAVPGDYFFMVTFDPNG